MARYRSPKHRVITDAATVLKRRIALSKVPKLRQKILKKQNNRCPLCERDMTRLRPTLDHCHKTGYIRGVLCNNCNGLEGKLAGLIARLDVGKIGVDRILANFFAWREEDNLYHKWIHPNVETLQEQKIRQKKRAAMLKTKR